eukprot:TRINITY_DN37438_c0_g1_i1.p1 TRINITY_DN37438_c0_g1~~TRINITY_DN37438_c0_g1_i1.p1  ORF type:complete len:203 (+),score=-18.22 TRINITY_DN37438_c0_g1_i1:97-705(+)
MFIIFFIIIFCIRHTCKIILDQITYLKNSNNNLNIRHSLPILQTPVTKQQITKIKKIKQQLYLIIIFQRFLMKKASPINNIKIQSKQYIIKQKQYKIFIEIISRSHKTCQCWNLQKCQYQYSRTKLRKNQVFLDILSTIKIQGNNCYKIQQQKRKSVINQSNKSQQQNASQPIIFFRKFQVKFLSQFDLNYRQQSNQISQKP